ncbi:unnamed protein product [Rotaria magnacalcarata]|uniref:Vacuolar fusion protein MON1 homolog n=3 Tax=Rotaria magnacalcarata TaxID=392030 RepID=A0A818XXZ4_9BILA|nr:unnamed protein product [Rotaria magnacalcarata]CAF1646388.1 unnamed protein product [Rotaria magnacalcarata]CAF2066657.1 unnamed protein product [Rotaria magnacalcarata]CAF2093977.1 unnamed protein product [Rotaria magnacalcarata]CAF2132161.1 unnamed protein product [Rotaria magnacalcarata]
MVDFIISRKLTNSDELISRLESLPSYGNLIQNTDEPALFDDEQEPQSGLIDFIRRNSTAEPSTIDSPNIIGTEDSIEDDITTNETASTPITATNSADELRNQENDDNYELHLNLLKSRVKHLFILSENGKPVFTRYGDEDQLVTLMGVMQTLVSFAEIAQSSRLNYLKAGPCRIAFLHREPFVFVLVTHTNEHSMCLLQQLTYVYHQIISTLTLSRIKQKFNAQPNFDIRRWLSNAERKLLHNIIDMYEHDLGMLMTSARCLILPANIRGQIGQTVAQTIRGQQDMLFAIILAHGQLVSIARLRNYHLHPSDLYLLINLVNSTDAFKGVESWVPVCLPRFDPGGCFHAHISYLDDSCDVCLVLLTVNPEHFQILSDYKQVIHEKLRKQNLTIQIKLALDKTRLLTDEIACSDLRYFAYKSRGLSQYISSKLLQPYVTNEQHVRLFELIRYVYGRLHNRNHNLKIVYLKAEYESLLAWLAPGFELHVVFSPYATLETVTQCTDRILSYIKREESQLFIIRCEYF